MKTIAASTVILVMFAFVLIVSLKVSEASGISLSVSSTPTPSPTMNPAIIDISPQPLPTDVPEINLSESADDFYGGRDVDCDGVRSSEDNCPFTYNPDQKDKDKNRIGDACDGANKGRIESHCDPDGDGIPTYKDNCPLVCNPNQEDKNKNGVGDACDSHGRGTRVPVFSPSRKPEMATPPALDLTPIIISPSPRPIRRVSRNDELTLEDMLDLSLGGEDFDCDGVKNSADNCPLVYNPDQKDTDNDRVGDACAAGSATSNRVERRCDVDGDGIENGSDNCPYVCNKDQKDSIHDGIGDACRNHRDANSAPKRCNHSKPKKSDL
jgi:hypothetical protein